MITYGFTASSSAQLYLWLYYVNDDYVVHVIELCAAAAADILLTPPPPPTACRRRAGAVFVMCSRHVVHQLYVARFL